MTAIIGVLNRYAVAVAADSAVTYGNTHKVVNSANKIFTLSKYSPVAIMTYSSASFMGVPWEIIIKEYRKNLGKKSFLRLEDYVNDFLTFLQSKNFFCDKETQHIFLRILISSFYEMCCYEICKAEHIRESQVTEGHKEAKFHQIVEIFDKVERCIVFEKYNYESFVEFAKNAIADFANSENINCIDLFTEAFFYFLRAKFNTILDTGLVFVGYGESEIYPSLIPLIVSAVVDNRLKYYIDSTRTAAITEHGPAAMIRPFAQTDVVQTIVGGINPSFRQIIHNTFAKSLREFSFQVADIIDRKVGDDELSSSIKGLDTDCITQKVINQINEEMNRTYTDSLMNTIVNLDKQDMANIAESFISLTSLVRRMQPGEETVGGPIDVAVISKGDGFVWINRKHYFKPEFNPLFLNNYFEK